MKLSNSDKYIIFNILFSSKEDRFCYYLISAHEYKEQHVINNIKLITTYINNEIPKHL